MGDQYSVALSAKAFTQVWSLLPRSPHILDLKNSVFVKQVGKGAIILHTNGYDIVLQHDPTAVITGSGAICVNKYGGHSAFENRKSPLDPSLLGKAFTKRGAATDRLTIESSGCVTRNHPNNRVSIFEIGPLLIGQADVLHKICRCISYPVPVDQQELHDASANAFPPTSIKKLERFLGDGYSIGLLRTQGTRFPYYLLAVSFDGNAAMICCPLNAPTEGGVSLASPTLAHRPSAAPDCLSRFGFGC